MVAIKSPAFLPGLARALQPIARFLVHSALVEPLQLILIVSIVPSKIVEKQKPICFDL